MINTLRNIDQAHAYFTECNLATLYSMAMIKSTSKSALSRQRSICLMMMEWVNGDEAAKVHRDCGRVLELLKAAAADQAPQGSRAYQDQLVKALDDEVASCVALQPGKKK